MNPTKRLYENVVEAAKGLRKELAAKFGQKYPLTRFRVRSERGGGSCLNVSWEFGPTIQEVEGVTWKYKNGRFDGMTDSYEYDPTQVVDESGEIMLHGGAQYVFCNREYRSKGGDWKEETELLTRVARHFCILEGLEFKSINNQYVYGEELCTIARMILGRSPLPTGYHGIRRHDGETAEIAENFRAF